MYIGRYNILIEGSCRVYRAICELREFVVIIVLTNYTYFFFHYDDFLRFIRTLQLSWFK